MISLHNGATGVPARPPLNVQKILTILLIHRPPVPTVTNPFFGYLRATSGPYG